MPRRWTAAVATAALALVALACEGGTGDGAGRPTRPPATPRSGSPSSIAALGDSITTGFGSCLSLTSCRRNSWSTGDGPRVDSLYRRLLDIDPTLRGHNHNEASAGARVSALPDQAAAAVRDGADLVTVLIGANDACRGQIDQMTPVADFRADLDRALRALKAGRPRARLLVLSIPDLNRLWEVGHTDRLAVRVWSHGVCPALLANATSNAPADIRRRAAFGDRINAYNDQLVAACRAYGSRCRSDGGAAHRVPFGLDLVNPLDFFHPDTDGQRALADVAWRTSGPGT